MMRQFIRPACAAILIAGLTAEAALAQQQPPRALTWQEVKDRFDASNPTLLAGRFNIDESRTDEVSAYLRPNPALTIGQDQIQPFTSNPYRPLTALLSFVSVNYLRERGNKRELRLDSARQGTAVAQFEQADLERNLLFNLRNAFVQALQAKAVLDLAAENLAYYDNVLSVSRDRFKAGDISHVDLDRLQLQRVQFETDVESAQVNRRTAKIQLLMLLNDRTPVDQFDVAGDFDFRDLAVSLPDLRAMALATRPDLRAAQQSIEKAKIDHSLAIANGTTDPVFGVDYGRNPPLQSYIGFNVSVPLRVFDKNQAEKERTALDITKNERLQNAAQAQVLNDVDSAYATINSSLNLLHAYKGGYLDAAVRVRDTMSFAYQRGGASLLDFLQAQNDYRNVQLSYLNLVGSYLSSANQLNLAVGREVIP